ncbi:hypothetical protein GO755_33610 [Spirosoma sp. HMF4905]|uniref:Uncharacterized protein n=1 Tax=Spirosoma arboris TaxID=2682092 RepID=A0A7K1SMW3_9BACT|nr:hypothetical protein [Spirosoma arboris]MVM35013.1 hypothetical protein [Spirosoma arboris]
MLQLKLYPGELIGMLKFLHRNTAGYEQLPLDSQAVSVLVMGQYLAKWTPQRLAVWQQRRTDKEYSLSLPLPVALALYKDMQTAFLGHQQQSFLDKLDHAIINSPKPYAGVAFSLQLY